MPSTSLQPRGAGGPGGIDRTDLNVGEDRLIDWPTLDESKILNDKDDAITKKTEIRVREPNQVPFPQRDRPAGGADDQRRDRQQSNGCGLRHVIVRDGRQAGVRGYGQIEPGEAAAA